MHEEDDCPSGEVIGPSAAEAPEATLVEADRLYYLEAQDFTD